MDRIKNAAKTTKNHLTTYRGRYAALATLTGCLVVNTDPRERDELVPGVQGPSRRVLHPRRELTYQNQETLTRSHGFYIFPKQIREKRN